MTTRMTVALAVLTLGLAIAALAGLPALIENRTVGDVVVILGFAVAIVGVLLVLFAVPGQRRETGKVKANDAIEIEKLRAERRRLASIEEQTERALQVARIRRSMSFSKHPSEQQSAEVESLTTALIELEAALKVNAAEFKRYGIEDADDSRPSATRSRPS